MRRMISLHRSFALLFLFVAIVGCGNIRDQVEKAIWADVPVRPSKTTTFPVVNSLPGRQFAPRTVDLRSHALGDDASLSLASGDYSIPVATFCMKSSAGSPSGHRYTLAKLDGAMADVLHDLHSRALATHPVSTVQSLSWAVQNGVKLERMNSRDQALARKVLARHLGRMDLSVWEKLERTWNKLRVVFRSLPSFDSLQDRAVDHLGPLGEWLIELRRSHERFVELGADYARVAAEVNRLTADLAATPGETPWSRIDERIYARFVTSGRYNQTGRLEVRVLPLANQVGSSAESGDRSDNALGTAASGDLVHLDVAGLVADPGVDNIQPLGLSPAFIQSFEEEIAAENARARANAAQISGAAGSMQDAQLRINALAEALLGRAAENLDRGELAKAHALLTTSSALLDVALSIVPGVSVAKDAYESVTGINLVTGQPLSEFEWAMAVVGVASLGSSKLVGAGISALDYGIDAIRASSNATEGLRNLENAATTAAKFSDAAKKFELPDGKFRDFVTDLASPKRSDHILYGDASGGGHLFPGRPGKTVFPESWSGEKILHEASDIVTDPSIRWEVNRTVRGIERFKARGFRDGVEIEVIVEPKGEGIISAWPVSGSGVIRNPN